MTNRPHRQRTSPAGADNSGGLLKWYRPRAAFTNGAFKISKRPPYALLASRPMTVQRNQRYEVKVVANGNTGDPMRCQLLRFQSRGRKMMTLQNGLGSGCTTATLGAHRPSDR